MKSHKVFAASAVFLSTALAASLFLSSKPSNKAEKTPKLNPTQVLTWDCENPEYKPETIMLTCADGGWMVHSITWSTWGIGGAEGAGIFREKLCEPSCAEGEIAEENVIIKLSDLAERKGKFYLRSLDISTASGMDFISGRANWLEWDVMEFIEAMNWD
jgi:hypothetical protein